MFRTYNKNIIMRVSINIHNNLAFFIYYEMYVLKEETVTTRTTPGSNTNCISIICTPFLYVLC